jgi:hypothetical protein
VPDLVAPWGPVVSGLLAARAQHSRKRGDLAGRDLHLRVLRTRSWSTADADSSQTAGGGRSGRGQEVPLMVRAPCPQAAFAVAVGADAVCG